LPQKSNRQAPRDDRKGGGSAGEEAVKKAKRLEGNESQRLETLAGIRGESHRINQPSTGWF